MTDNEYMSLDNVCSTDEVTLRLNVGNNPKMLHAYGVIIGGVWEVLFQLCIFPQDHGELTQQIDQFMGDD